MIKRVLFLIGLFLLFMPTVYDAAKIPDYVVDISSENTAKNEDEHVSEVKPSKLTRELIKTANEQIENMQLIRLLNESSMNKSVLAFGNRATIYLGEWPLNYQSDKQTINWQYQKINSNMYDNQAGTTSAKMMYTQQSHKIVTGGLTAKTSDADEIQQMILRVAEKSATIPVALQTNIGAGTKANRVFDVQPKQVGNMEVFVPAVIEKGEVMFGEVYLEIKGSKRNLMIKNVTSQQIGALLPIEGHVSIIFTAK